MKMDFCGQQSTASADSSCTAARGMDPNDDLGFVDGRDMSEIGQREECGDMNDIEMANGTSCYPDMEDFPDPEGGVVADDRQDMETGPSSFPVVLIDGPLFEFEDDSRPDNLSPACTHIILNHQVLSMIPFIVAEHDDDEDMAPPPPSTTSTMHNHHGSPGSSLLSSEPSVEDNRELRRRARKAKARATRQQAREYQRRSRFNRYQIEDSDAAYEPEYQPEYETENMIVDGVGLSPRWPKDHGAQGPFALLDDFGLEIGPSGYPLRVIEQMEDLVEHPEAAVTFCVAVEAAEEHEEVSYMCNESVQDQTGSLSPGAWTSR